MSGFKEPALSDTQLANSPFYIRFGVPILLTVTATLIKLSLTVYIGVKTPYLLYFGVVIITAKYFGKIAAIVVTGLSAVLVNVLFIYPYFDISLTSEAIIQSTIFILECILLIGLSSALYKAKKIIDKNDARFKALVERSSEGILTMDINGKFLYCSPSVQTILGFTDQELLSQPSWELLHQDEILEIKEEFFRFLAHPNKTATFLHRMKHKNGHWVWIESKNTNLLNEAPIHAIISNFSDVTERVLNENLRDDFISAASLELNAPLTSVKAYTQLLQTRFEIGDDDTSLAILKEIEFQINKVLQILTNLLDLTTLQQKKFNLNVNQFDFNALVTEVVDGIQNNTGNHKILLDLAPTHLLFADKERLGQVVTNLVTNAIKYSPDLDTVNVSSKAHGGEIALYVQDKGVGIKNEDLSKVFDRFYRANGAKQVFQGLGLGLFICRQIIEQHEGKIGVMSEEGKGSIFWFSLPLNS